MAKYNEIQLRNGETIKLTDREILFCKYYLGEANKNATQAAIKAGYSPKTANPQAAQVLAKLSIQKYLKNETDPLMEALGITQEKILKRLADIAFTDLSDLTDDDWNLLNKSQIDKKHHAAMGAVEIDEKILMQNEGGQLINRKIKYRLKSQEKALITLAERAGLIDRKPAEQPNQPQQINFNQINNYVRDK